MDQNPKTIVECYVILDKRLQTDFPDLDPILIDALRTDITMLLMHAYQLGSEKTHTKLETQISDYRWERDIQLGNVK